MKTPVKHRDMVWLAVLALGCLASPSLAQCKSGQQRQSTTTQQQTSLQQQLLLQQQFQQQLLMRTQQQFNTLVSLQQQQQNTLVGTIEQQPQNALLVALKQQRQQNSALIALEKKQRNTFRSYQTGKTAGFATASEDRQFLAAIQAAAQQTAELLAALEQANVVVNQSLWRSTLERQSTALTDLSQLYGSSAAD